MSKEIKEEKKKIRKVFLDDLPRGGLNRGNRINWKESIGYKVPFIYDDIEGKIEIVNKKDDILYIKYLDNYIFKINIQNFSRCSIGVYLKNITICSPWMIKYFQGGYDEAKLYTCSCDKKVQFICPSCGRLSNKLISISDLYRRKSIHCRCSDGTNVPNKIMFNILEQLNINFISEYSPEWIKPKRYDFYFELNEDKYIIEMDGHFHNKDNTLSGQSAKESQHIDNIKDRLALQNKCKIIRINCEYNEINSRVEYIKNNILISKLNDIFDLSLINWNRVEDFCISSRMRKACEYKRINSDMTTVEIAKIMKAGRTTVRLWLIKGHELGLCNYNSDAERQRMYSNSNFKKNNCKQIIVLKNEKVLGIFNSGVELEIKSKDIFNVEFKKKGVSSACINRKSYKDYHFKYVQDLTEEEKIKYNINITNNKTQLSV